LSSLAFDSFAKMIEMISMKIPSIDQAELHPAGVIDSIHIEPPIVTWPVQNINIG